MSVDRDSEYYNMNHKRRGMAIIFNHKYFDDIYLKHRVGTNVDSDNLKKTMERLGFEVKLHDDLTHDELMKMVDEG
jgi:caspase-like apoptosis-related cysteine protease